MLTDFNFDPVNYEMTSVALHYKSKDRGNLLTISFYQFCDRLLFVDSYLFLGF